MSYNLYKIFTNKNRLQCWQITMVTNDCNKYNKKNYD